MTEGTYIAQNACFEHHFQMTSNYKNYRCKMISSKAGNLKTIQIQSKIYFGATV